MDAKEVQVTEETTEGLNYTTKEVLAMIERPDLWGVPDRIKERILTYERKEKMLNTFGAWFVGLSMILALILVLRAISAG